MNLEKTILENFKKLLKKEVEGLDLYVVLTVDEYGEWLKQCEIMEKRDYGRVWTVECTKSGKIKNYYEL